MDLIQTYNNVYNDDDVSFNVDKNVCDNERGYTNIVNNNLYDENKRFF